MKNIRRFGTVLVMIAATLLLCSGIMYASEADVTGRYDAVECWNEDGNYHCEEEYLLLNEDGSGEIRFNQSVYPVEWKSDGSELSFTDEDGETETGTIKDGVIKISYAGYQYIYAKDGAYTEPSASDSEVALSTLPEADGSEDAISASSDGEDAPGTSSDADAGEDTYSTSSDGSDTQAAADLSTLPEDGEPIVFEVTSRETISGSSGPSEDSSVWRLDYIAMNGDGTGVFLFNKSALTIRWKLEGESYSFTDHTGNQFTGSLEGNRISGVYGQYRYTFDETGRTLPVYTLSPKDWGKGLAPVFDQAGVLTDAQKDEFTKRAQELADRYDVGVNIVLIDKRDDYTWTRDLETLCEEINAGYSLGIGPTEKKEKHEEKANADWKDDILLTVAFDDRRYEVYVSGDYAVWAFQQYALEAIRDMFIDDFRENEWTGGISEYLDGVEKVLKVAEKGHVYSFKYSTAGRLIGILVPILLAVLFGYGIAAVMRSSMKDTRIAQNAASYVAGNQVKFTRREDRYIRTLVSRVYSPREKSKSGGGGGGFHSSSSGGSHIGGSF